MTEQQQQQAPLAFLKGEAVLEKPEDLYIPPDALQVILESFEGPLDLLLYLIKRHKLDILELPILSITQQYVHYVEMMQDFQLELAGEYLVMAALLAQIKSRLLLPTHEEIEEEEDPRAELVRRLQEYEQFKQAAENLDKVPRVDRDIFIASALIEDVDDNADSLPDVELRELLLAMSEVMARAKKFEHHQISAETLSTRERMSKILQYLSENPNPVEFSVLFQIEEGRSGVVVTFIAMLELLKEQLISIVQVNLASAIYLSLKLQE
ncbi:segregation and condensation protein A [Pseudoalteromonas luteoviolacea]|uniref:segregation and condensation protein A n=1 Tax=Pseudoalteromonas luteoviolacea TaxID=43657 RepID=UPI0011509573|nr:segregation/condensation protein A [Pseudoalteromonas luteoviolacea]TQF71386.1 segregation/condensation protein A [Pseudoalteromonas luteoviolacea]